MKTQEEIRKYLDEKIAEKGTNYRELSLAIGRKDQYIHQYIKYGLPQQLKEDDRRAIARILDIDEQELSSKPLYPPITPIHSDGISVLMDQALKLISNLRKKNIETISIDMLDAVACCGTGVENFSENVNGKWLMPLVDFRQITMSAPDNIKMIKVKGDSMEPTLRMAIGYWLTFPISRPIRTVFSYSVLQAVLPSNVFNVDSATISTFFPITPITPLYHQQL